MYYLERNLLMLTQVLIIIKFFSICQMQNNLQCGGQFVKKSHLLISIIQFLDCYFRHHGSQKDQYMKESQPTEFLQPALILGLSEVIIPS